MTVSFAIGRSEVEKAKSMMLRGVGVYLLIRFKKWASNRGQVGSKEQSFALFTWPSYNASMEGWRFICDGSEGFYF